MAKPNYAFEKRQKELAKKQKKEEKLQRRTVPTDSPAEETPAQPNANDAEKSSG